MAITKETIVDGIETAANGTILVKMVKIHTDTESGAVTSELHRTSVPLPAEGSGVTQLEAAEYMLGLVNQHLLSMGEAAVADPAWAPVRALAA